jgi:hypothetical protein
MGNLLQGFTTVVWSPSGPNVKYENSGTWARGDLYEPQQLCKVYPALAPLYHPFEREYDPEPVLNMMKKNNYALPLASVALYCIFLAVGPRIMKNRPALPLKTAFAYWNLFLSIFSFYGVSRTVPHLLYRVFSESFEDSVCKSAHVGYGGGTTGLAVQIFILSKIPELLDTVFLILLKKEVIFLHWYHHITVLLYCWNSYVTESAAGLWFVAMNYSVHSIMYLHFYLQTSFPTPKDKTQKPKGGLYALARLMSRNAILITVMQIMQMFVGTSIVLACLYYNKYGVKIYKYKYSMSKCNNVDSNLLAGGVMYASYLALFVAFAFRRFALGKDDFKKPAASQQDKKIK